MKKIKSMILVIGLLAATLLSGCSGLKQPTTQQRIVFAAKTAAYVGTAEYLTQKPKDKPAFISASMQLHALATQTNIDLVNILAIVNQLPIKELKSEQARIVVTAGTLLLIQYGETLPVDRLKDLQPVAAAIGDGIDLAAAAVP